MTSKCDPRAVEVTLPGEINGTQGMGIEKN